MPRLVVDVAAQPVDLARWASLLHLLRDRFRTLEFDADGVVRLPEGRREGLRVVAGEAGRTGATYRIVTWELVIDPATGGRRTSPSPPALLTVQQDDSRALRVALSTPVDGSAAAPTHAFDLTVPTPDAPVRAEALLALPMPDLPRWLGRRMDLQAVLDVGDPAHPVLAATGQLRQATATARLEHTGQTLRADLSVTPRGPLVFAALVWPFVAGRARRTVATGMREWWATVVSTLDPAATPEAVADELVGDLARTLVDRLPADSTDHP